MKIKTNSDGWIVAIGSGLTDYAHEIETDKDIQPANPSTSQEAWHWNNGNPELRETGASPNPDTAYDEIEQILIDAFEADGSSTPEIDAMSLINRYPAVVKALERENYERVSTFIEQKIQPNESIVGDQMVSDIKDVLKVSQ